MSCKFTLFSSSHSIHKLKNFKRFSPHKTNIITIAWLYIIFFLLFFPKNIWTQSEAPMKPYKAKFKAKSSITTTTKKVQLTTKIVDWIKKNYLKHKEILKTIFIWFLFFNQHSFFFNNLRLLLINWFFHDAAPNYDDDSAKKKHYFFSFKKILSVLWNAT